MKIAFTGGSGFIASHFKMSFNDFEYVDLKRDESASIWKQKLKTVDAVINLAGAPIFQRWSVKNKKVIEQSRVLTTQKLVACLNELGNDASEVLISGSAIGIYRNNDDKPSTERNPEYGVGFLSEVVQKWEKAAIEIQNPKVRLVITRIGIVLGNNGGIIKQMEPIFKAGVGGILGNGTQKMAFIHIDDLVSAFRFLIEEKASNGVFNMVAPEVVSNKKFSLAFAQSLKRKVFLPVPGFILRILFGESAEIMLKGEWVLPEKLLELNFPFQYRKIEAALKQLSIQ